MYYYKIGTEECLRNISFFKKKEADDPCYAGTAAHSSAVRTELFLHCMYK